nr:MAG TPA: baseplate assembly protein [Caudoviricetes sp.]
MSADVQNLFNLPDISVIDDVDIETMKNEMVRDYEEAYKAETGESITLYPADKDRLKLNIVANKLFQAYQCIDNGFRMNFLRYSYGDYLKHLGANRKIYKQEARPAVTVLRFSIQEPRAQVTAIPKGKRATAGDNIFFMTDDYAEIQAGELSVDVAATCTQAGTVGNKYIAGQINALADKIPYITGVINVSESTGGSDEESDAAFRERIYLAPSTYSTAGTEDAYIYWVRQYNSAAIEDVKVRTDENSIVDIRIVLANGELPGKAFLDGLKSYLTSDVKPLTDKINVSAPDVVEYNLDFTYYIGRSNKENVEAIQASAQEAASEWSAWQKTHIGADINTDMLIEYLRAAGVKRAVIRTPVYTAINDTQIAVVKNITAAYGGLEND